ncbi:MAG: RluA family pseudouridine synthase [Desulfovibrio sp.]|nr:RluA family pseudouridine synthase [Desulfovibrio sp.]MCA1986247.1 RluA family pseudouridine synthase [Desulfovibrio sp.]
MFPAVSTWIIPPALDGQRLDVALAALAALAGTPAAPPSRRAAHRLLERGHVLLDGRPAHKGLRVRAGQRLELRLPPAVQAPLPVQMVCRTPEYAALAKPSGLHTAALAGDPGQDSLERRLPALFPDCEARLCNRLDRETSGLVLVAFSPAAAAAYRAHENAGAVDKCYHAVVHGLVEAPLVLDRALDVHRRAVTRVEPFTTADPLRITRVQPLRALAQARTLVECRIRKGARHQIRAHLAAAGHPIVGDPVYGHDSQDGQNCQEVQECRSRLMLHHTALAFPGFQAAIAPEFNTV